MTSLVFRALDEHVVEGLADHPAIDDDRGTLSYAQLLHESASLAGALTNLGVDELAIDLPDGRERVIAVLACARLGVLPRGAATNRLGGAPPVLRMPDTAVPWAVLVQTGRVDPAPAPARDPEGYEALIREEYDELFSTLLAGDTLT